jgi:hypothetical protein
VQRLPAPALRQQFIAQLSRQCGNAAIQRVLAADPVAVPADADGSSRPGGQRLPIEATVSRMPAQFIAAGADSGRTVRRRRIQRRCLTCEEEQPPVVDQGPVRRMATELVSQRAPAPATEAAGDRRAEAAGDERGSAPAAAEGICPECGRRGTGTCACGQPFMPVQRQAIARAPRRRHPWEQPKGKAPAPGVKPTPAPAPAQQDASPPPVNAEARATPENVQLAKVIDALAKLTVPELVKRREEALTGAISATGDEQRRHLDTLHAIEYLASQRDLPDLQYQKGDESRVTRRGMRLSLQERVRRTGSFDKAMAEFATVQGIEPGLGKRMEPHLEFFRAERKAFATEFKGQAYLTTERMLTESRQAINEVLKSYGLPVDSASVAAQRVAKGASEEDEAQHVIQAATKSAGVDEQKNVRHRRDLADEVEVLKKHQQAVKANWQEHEDLIAQFRNDRSKFNPSLRDKNNEEMDAARTALRVGWIKAERLHPVLATYRHGKDLGAVDPKIREAEIDPLAEVDLGKLDTDPVERQMQAVVAQLLPKMVDIGKAKGLLKDKKDAFTLTLPSVVLLTRTNMFIPKGSIRDGVVNDLVAGAKDDSGLVQALALALALITLIPSGGASLAIPAGAAAIGLAAYSATQEWEKYTTGKTLTNTNLDLARSLSTEEPSLTGFALSLVDLGLEALPLVGAFNRARKIKNLANTGADFKALQAAVDDLNRYGREQKTVGDLGDRALRESRKGAKKEVAEGAQAGVPVKHAGDIPTGTQVRPGGKPISSADDIRAIHASAKAHKIPAEVLEADVAALRQQTASPANVRRPADPTLDVEMSARGHKFERSASKRTWCRRTIARCPLDLGEDLNQRVDKLKARMKEVEEDLRKLGKQTTELKQMRFDYEFKDAKLGKQLGEGSGSNKTVYAVAGRDDVAIGILKPGRPAAALTEEIELLKTLEAQGLATVKVLGTTVHNGRPAMVMQRYAQGSKEIVIIRHGQVRSVGQSSLLNQKSIDDLEKIRSIMQSKSVQIDDLQFLIGRDGSIVIADPLKVIVGKSPSTNNLATIDELVKMAKSNVARSKGGSGSK